MFFLFSRNTIFCGRCEMTWNKRHWEAYIWTIPLSHIRWTHDTWAWFRCLDEEKYWTSGEMPTQILWPNTEASGEFKFLSLKFHLIDDDRHASQWTRDSSFTQNDSSLLEILAILHTYCLHFSYWLVRLTLIRMTRKFLGCWSNSIFNFCFSKFTYFTILEYSSSEVVYYWNVLKMFKSTQLFLIKFEIVADFNTY